MGIAVEPPVKRLRRLIWIEIAALVSVSLITVVPLRVGYPLLGLAPATVADFYFYASLTVIAIAQTWHLHPIRTFQVLNWKLYAGGVAVTLALLAIWFTRHGGRTLDFSNMEQGAIFSPIVFAIALPVIQAVTHLIATNSIVNMSGSETYPNPPSAQSHLAWIRQTGERERSKSPKVTAATAWSIGVAASVAVNVVPFALILALLARAPDANKIAVLVPTILIFGIVGYLFARSIKSVLTR